MTSLATAISIDSRGPAALYIMTDSRITWKDFPGAWDAGQKTFASHIAPHIFGFCGDASFPPSVARQVLERIDYKLLTDITDAYSVHIQIVKSINASLSVASSKFFDVFSFYHGARDGEGMGCKFRLWRTDYSRKLDRTTDTEIEIASEYSQLVRVDGTGRPYIQSVEGRWDATTAAKTSRAAMWAFCEALASGADPHSGGPPQLVGIWRVGGARRFGIIWNDQRYVAGLPVAKSEELRNINWFNERFERCDALTGKRIQSAQAQEKPPTNMGME